MDTYDERSRPLGITIIAAVLGISAILALFVLILGLNRVSTLGLGVGMASATSLEVVRKGQRSRSILMSYFSLSGLFNRKRQVFCVPPGCREKSRWLQKPMKTEQWKMALEAFSYSL